jgi:phosphatidylserine/phosphatidylglycerophosphate/cardiolipin synthase-like enzyme
MSKFTFYPRDDYFHDLTARVSKTKKGDRVALASMTFHPNQPLINDLFIELYAAASRGVMVHVMVDAFSFMIKEGFVLGPLMFTRKLPSHLTRTFRLRLGALKKLQELGGRYTITNLPSRPLSVPFAGRSHIKFAVVNNDVYIGGCNLSNGDQLDMMVGWNDPGFADRLWNFEKNVFQTKHIATVLDGKDLTIPIDKTANILVDAGIANQSIIFDKALALIDAAQKYVYITCQFLPNDITLRHLSAAAARGVDVTIIYNHPDKHVFPHNLLHHSVVQFEKTKHPAYLFVGQLSKKHHYLHAKLLATDQGTIIGSHNYVKAGVAFGTAEIALVSTDPTFSKEAVDTFEKLK